MAAISSANQLFFDQSGSQRVSVLRLNNVTSGDTIDVSTVGSVAYTKVNAAAFLASSTGTGALATVAGTNLTLTLAGMANDTVTLVVEGQGS